jgi:hypothetical protein
VLFFGCLYLCFESLLQLRVPFHVNQCPGQRRIEIGKKTLVSIDYIVRKLTQGDPGLIRFKAVIKKREIVIGPGSVSLL